MARIIADRVFETSTSTGTGPLTVGAAVSGFRRFNTVCAVGDTFEYTAFAVDGSGNPTGAWETGLGTYSAANTITRTTVQASSNGNAAVNFAAGTKYVQLSHNAASLSASSGGSGGSGSVGSHRYWALLPLNTAGGNIQIQAIGFYDGATRKFPTSFTAGSEYDSGYLASNLLDDTGSYWTGVGLSSWLFADFGSPVSISSIQIMPVSAALTQAPSNFTVCYSDDGASWTAVSSVGVLVNTWAASTWKTFAVPTTTASGGGGSLVLLSTKIVNSGDTEVLFTGLDNSKYSQYKLYCDYLWLNTDWQSISGQVSTDNGSTWINTGYDFSFNITGNSGSGNTVQTVTNGSSIRMLPGQNSSNLNGGSGEWDFFNFGSSTLIKTFRGRVTWYPPDTSRYNEISGGRILTTSAINAIRLFADAGTIGGGKFRLYGII